MCGHKVGCHNAVYHTAGHRQAGYVRTFFTGQVAVANAHMYAKLMHTAMTVSLSRICIADISKDMQV